MFCLLVRTISSNLQGDAFYCTIKAQEENPSRDISWWAHELVLVSLLNSKTNWLGTKQFHVRWFVRTTPSTIQS